LDRVEVELAGLGFEASTRVKTKDVLLDKLRRESGMALARVQDIAGARIVVHGCRLEQDESVSRIYEHFEAITNREPRVVDRRISPSHGYRAVHVVAFIDEVPVEIQVRTELQNLWAQIVERLADRWGRGIRYGGLPDLPGQHALDVKTGDGRPVTRRRIIEDLREMADVVDSIERSEAAMEQQRRSGTGHSIYERHSVDDFIASVDKRSSSVNAGDIRGYYNVLRRRFKRGMEQLAKDRRRVGRLVRRVVPVILEPTREDLGLGLARIDDLLIPHMAHQYEAIMRSNERVRATLRELEQYVGQGGLR
jgi:hypothetical protein